MIKYSPTDLQSIIKIRFNNIALLKQSLIHKSFNNIDNNEKLEFLGDRVLGLIIAQKLIEIYPNDKEGIIDKKYANLVNKKICAKIANSINLKKYMTLGLSYKGFVRSDEKILSDGLEALIGAIYVDTGIKSAEKFVLKYWNSFLENSVFTPVDSKTKLQEFTLKKYKILPTYKLHKESGPKHNPIFKIEVQIPGSKIYSGIGDSKKKAQQNAASKLLRSLKIL